MTTVTTATTTKSITATSTTTMMSTSFGAADRPLAVNKAPAPTRALTSYDDVSNEDFPRLRCTNVVYQQQEQEVLWPCLYFPSYNRAYDELKTLTDKDLFPETYLTKLANIFLSHVLDGEDICPDTTPFLLTIGPTMLLIFEPSKETCLSYGRCVKNFIRNRGLVPGLDDAVRTAKKILDCSSSTTTNIGISLPAMATNSKTSNARIVEATKARASTGGRNASATTKPAAKEVSDSVGNHRYDHYVRARQVSPGEDGKQPGKSGMQVAEDSLGAYIRGPLPASPHAKTATTAREEQKTTGVNCATEKKPSASNDPEKPKTPSHDAASKTSDEKNKEEEASATMKEDVVMQDSSDTASEMVAKASEKGAAVQSNKQDNAATTSTTGNAKSVAEANLKESPKNKTKKTAPAATKPQGGKKENMETNQEKKLGSAKKARKDASPSQSQRKKRTFTIAKKDRRIPKLNDVKATLEGLGFTIYEKNGQTYYCLPGKDPASDSFAVEGEHYFTSEEAFRAHLCSRGLGDQLNFDEYCQGYALLQKWIRFSIVKSSCVKKSELPKEFVGSHNVWNLLSLLGLKVRNGIYALKDGTSFVGEREFSVHLSQYGLPGDSDFGNITEDERLQLELRFAEYKRDLLLPNPLM